MRKVIRNKKNVKLQNLLNKNKNTLLKGNHK